MTQEDLEEEDEEDEEEDIEGAGAGDDQVGALQGKLPGGCLGIAYEARRAPHPLNVTARCSSSAMGGGCVDDVFVLFPGGGRRRG